MEPGRGLRALFLANTCHDTPPLLLAGSEGDAGKAEIVIHGDNRTMPSGILSASQKEALSQGMAAAI